MASQPYPACALPEGSRYYLLRGNVMIPLVPVDQLPFQLQHVPRQLTHPQMSDGGWKFCSETNEAPTMLSVQAPSFPSQSSTTQPRFFAPDHHIRAESHVASKENVQQDRWPRSSLPIESTPELSRLAPMPIPERTTSLADKFASIYPKDAQRLGYRGPYPSGVEPDPLKKVYCTHWIRTGECNFTATGCKYKHEMPGSEKLRELGFQNIPRWWKEKSAIAPRLPTSLQRQMARSDDTEQPCQMPAPRAFNLSMLRNSQAENRHTLSGGAQQLRGILGRSVGVEPLIASRPTPPPAPVSTPVQRTSRVTGDLIKFDDAPATPPHPESPPSSSTNAESSDTQNPASCDSVSPPPAQSVECSSSSTINCGPASMVDTYATLVVDSEASANKTPSTVLEKTAKAEDPSIHCHSSISWASETEEETVSKHPNPIQKPKRARDGSTRHPAVPAKRQPGLASSRHASQYKGTEHRSKNADNHTRNANRKVKANKVGAPYPHDQSERLRPRSQRAKKGEGRAAAVVASVEPAAV